MLLGVMELDQITSLTAQLASIIKQLGKGNVNSIQTNIVCNFCAGSHPSLECQMENSFSPSVLEQVNNYMLNHQ